MRPGCFDPYLYKPEDVEKANFMVSDVMGLAEEQMFITGIVIIIDLEGYSLGHVTQKPLAVTKKQMHFLQVRIFQYSSSTLSILWLSFLLWYIHIYFDISWGFPYGYSTLSQFFSWCFISG